MSTGERKTTNATALGGSITSLRSFHKRQLLSAQALHHAQPRCPTFQHCLGPQRKQNVSEFSNDTE